MKRRAYTKPPFKGWNIARENVIMAFAAIKSNRLRSALTISIIALGITSIVGILTAVDSIGASLDDAYSRMGAGIVNITSEYHRPGDRGRIRNPKEISKAQAERFIQYFPADQAIVTMFSMAASDIAVEAGGRKTTPNMHVMATDAGYLAYQDIRLAQGRNFTEDDIRSGAAYAILGSNVAASLFGAGSTQEAIGSPISIKGVRYIVIGVAQSVGSAGSSSMDSRVLVPYTQALASLTDRSPDFSIGILPFEGTDHDAITAEATQAFRAVRRLAPYDDNDFEISQSDAVMAQLDETMGTLTLAAAIIGLITLVGAAVGLMNIMLVSVKERTREIGTRKALGASSKRIRNQFLLEAIIIGELGGAAGIVAGILIGNTVSAIMDNPFIIPWTWIGASILLCMAVGITSGYLPASRAAALDPIECLRYE